MLAELFYPKELKDAIRKLRAENDLNEEALRNLNRQPFIIFIAFLLIMILFIIMGGQKGLYISFVAFAIALFLMPYLIRNAYFSHMAAYLHGQSKKGKIMKSYFTNPDFPVKTVVIQPNDDGQIFKLKPGSVWSRKYSGGPKEGDIIQYFESANTKHKCVPDTEEVKKLFCLSKTILEEKNHD